MQLSCQYQKTMGSQPLVGHCKRSGDVQSISYWTSATGPPDVWGL